MMNSLHTAPTGVTGTTCMIGGYVTVTITGIARKLDYRH